MELRWTIFFAWYDFWIGFFYDRKEKAVYFCPLPMIVIKLEIDMKTIKCRCAFCDKEIEVEVYKISSDSDDCLGIACEDCAE